MEVVAIKSANAVLSFLERYSYATLPKALWDHYLWLYNCLLDPLSSVITGYESEQLTFFLVLENGSEVGAAYARYSVNGFDLFFDALDYCALEALTEYLQKEGYALKSVSLRNESFAYRFIETSSQFELVEAVHQYFIEAPLPFEENPMVRELSGADVCLFDASGGWPEFPDCISEGLRYFGYVRDGVCISVAGIARLTRFRSEIIGVGTLFESQRRRGYARAVCAKAIAEALRDTTICTWTANCANTASNALAKSLGMQLYNSRFVFEKRS